MKRLIVGAVGAIAIGLAYAPVAQATDVMLRVPEDIAVGDYQYGQDAGGSRETYVVFPHNVLPDEPGHLVGF